jgi:hypothetical protein
MGDAARVERDEDDEETGADEGQGGFTTLAHLTVCHCPGGARCLKKPDRECAACGKSTQVVLAAGDHAMALCHQCLAVALDGRRADQPPRVYLWGGPPPVVRPAAAPTGEEIAGRLIDDLLQLALFGDLDEWAADEALPVRTVRKPRTAPSPSRHRPPSPGTGGDPSAAPSATQAELLALFG